MSTDRDTTRIVRSWLRTDENESADRVLGTVLDRLDTTPQRRATWWPARRPPLMMTAIKYGLAAAVLAISTAVGITLLTQGGFGTTPDEPAPESPAASVSPEDEALISDWFEEANESDEYPCFFTPLRYEQIGHQTLVRIIFTQKPEGTCTSEYVDSEDTFVFFVSGGEIIDHP